MPPIRSTIRVHRGSDWRQAFQTSPVENLTGKSLRFVAAARLDTTDVLIDVAATVTDGPAGQCRVDFLSADTAGLDRGTYQWELREELAGGRKVYGYGDLVLYGIVKPWP